MSTANHGTEIAEKLRTIREQIRKRIETSAPPPQSPPPLPLESVRQSQAEARAWAGAIGTINPRPPGLANGIIQAGKRSVARVLDWHVRPQREFNWAVANSLENLTEELRRLREELGREIDSVSGQMRQVSRAQQKLVEEMESAKEQWSEQIQQQRWTYEGELARHSTAVENRLRELTEGLQAQTEALRLVRQRLAAQSRTEAAGVAADSPAGRSVGKTTKPVSVDYFQFERQFRGTEEEIRDRQSFYAPFFRGRQNVLDIACGRGEFLELMRREGVHARGVDLDADMVASCLEKDLDVVKADAFEYLEAVPDGSLDGIFNAQFVEHLEPETGIRLVSACAQKLAPAGILVIETQNPECLAIFSQSFYLDPTHVRPVPPGLLRFLYAEAGLTRITTHFLAPAAAHLPLVPKLESRVMEPANLQAWNAAVARFNETFFGGMDYAVIGHRAESPEM